MHIRLPINIHNAMALWRYGAMVPWCPAPGSTKTMINQDDCFDDVFEPHMK